MEILQALTGGILPRCSIHWGGSKDPGWTLKFLIKPCGCVVAPPLFDNQAEGKVTASKHSVGGAILDICLCVQEDAFVAAKAWARAV